MCMNNDSSVGITWQLNQVFERKLTIMVGKCDFVALRLHFANRVCC
jgi:hypothetical protein